MPRRAESQARVLVLAPTSKDAQTTAALLGQVDLTCILCTDIRDLARRVTHGAEAVLLTEEALASDGIDEFVRVLREQPRWSDLPIVLLVREFVAPSASEVLRSLSNVTVLDRPAPMRSLVSAVQAAIRSRQRQYQLRAAMAETEESLSLLHTLVGNAPLGIAFLDPQMRFQLLNASLAQMNGVSMEAHLGRTLAEVVPSLVAAVEPLFHEALDGRPVVSHAVAGATPNAPADQRQWLESWYPVQTRDHRTLGVGVIVQDVTEQRRAEEERRHLLDRERAARSEAERANRIKDEFLATISHELRTPLNAILGWAQLLQRIQTPSSADLAEGLEAITRSARSLAELVEDLLDMGRIVSGKLRLDFRAVDPATVARAALETVRPAAEAKEVRLEPILDSGVGPVKGDPSRIQQVIWNLLTNAVKFTPPGGTVQVMLERVGSNIEVSVADTGSGIEPDFLPHVFERFAQADSSSTRAHRGLGLGLAIVKNLVEMHGGSVRARSPGIGKGATFTFTLPQVDASETDGVPVEQPHKGEASAPPFDFSLAGLRVLVVDDERDAREVMSRVLRSCQAIPITAASAREALDILQREKVDLLLSDIGMPEDDGYWLIRQVRALPPEQGGSVPAAALTAFARSEDRERVLLSGYSTHISKPVDTSELLTIIAGLAGRVPV